MRRRQWEEKPPKVRSEEEVRVRGPWQLYVLSTLPLRSISRVWGRFNAIELPVFMRVPGYKLYSWIFGCRLDELKEPDLTKYRNLAEFFSRELRDDARVIDPIAALVSPADGTVLHFGEIEGQRVEQVKGLSYSLDTLLGLHEFSSRQQQIDFTHPPKYNDKEFADLNGIAYSLDQLLGDEPLQKASSHPEKTHDASLPPEQTKHNKEEMVRDIRQVGREVGLTPHGTQPVHPGNKLYFIVIYLAPGDYHRFHSPTNWVAESRRHFAGTSLPSTNANLFFAGELFSVSPYIAHRIPNLFTLNERVALLGRWRHGFFSMVPVGATNVGSINLHFDKDLRTNNLLRAKPDGSYEEATYANSSSLLRGHALRRGEQMGGFSLGSTIILVFEAPRKGGFLVGEGAKVRVGEAIFREDGDKVE
jgi:phosphatidylserine decarboxylase